MPPHDPNDLFFRKPRPRIDRIKTHVIGPSEINHLINEHVLVVLGKMDRVKRGWHKNDIARFYCSAIPSMMPQV